MSSKYKIYTVLLLFLMIMTMIPVSSDAADNSGNPEAVIETSKGTIKVELFEDDAPITVENFKKYAQDGFYKDLIFHRVIKDFMIQGGGYNTDMEKVDPTYDPIENEAEKSGHRNKRGTIAMARTQDPDSATSQFFINHADNSDTLDWDTAEDGAGYCVFGEVTDGMDVVDEIANVETTDRNAPVNDIIIESVTIEQAADDSDVGGNSNGNELTDDSSTSSGSESSPFYTDILFIEVVVSLAVAGAIILFLRFQKTE